MTLVVEVGFDNGQRNYELLLYATLLALCRHSHLHKASLGARLTIDLR